MAELIDSYEKGNSKALNFAQGIRNGSIQLKNGQTMLQGYQSYLKSTGKEAQLASIKTKALSASMKVLSTIGWMAIFTAASWAISKGIEAIDNYIHRLDNAKDALENTEAELSSVKSEIEQTTNKIKELESLDPSSLSITDKEDLQRLRDQNEELRIRQQYLEKQHQYETNNVAELTKEKYNLQYGASVDREQIDKYKKLYTNNRKSTPASSYLSGGNTMQSSSYVARETNNDLSRESDSLANLIAQYEYYSDEKKKALNNEDAEAIDKYNSKLEEISNKLITNRQELQGFSDDLTVTGESSTELDEITNKLEIIDNLLLTPGQNLVNFLNSESLTSSKEKLTDLANIGKLTQAELSKNFVDVNSYLKENGLTLEDLISVLKTYKEELASVPDVEKPNLSISETIEQLSEMKSALSTLDQAFAKLYDKDQQIGFDDFAAISEAFKGMDGLDDFISRLQDAGQDTEKVTSVMEDLIGAYLEFSGILDNVTDENQGLIVSMLEEMGVANASEIVNLALANSHIEVAVQKIMNANASFDLATATAEEINKMIEEAGESDIVRQKLALLALQKQLCNQTTIMTDGDIQNLQALARQAGATSAAIAAIKNTNAKLTKYEHYYKRNPEKAEKLWQETYDGIYNSIPNKTQLDFKQAKNSSGSPYAPRYSGGPSTQKAIKSAANDAAKAAKKAKEEFKELFDFFERRVKVLDDAFDLLKANLDNVVGAFAKNNLIDAQVGILDEKMKNYTDATAMYTQKANESLSKLDAGLQEKVKNGAVDLSTFVGDGNEEVVEAIKDYQNWADKIADCKQELAELKQKIRELELEKFNNIIEDFTNQFDLYGDSVDLIGKQIDLFKEAGMMIGESFYSVQKQQSEKQLATLEAEKAKLTEQLTSALSSGRIQQGTDEWLEMVNALTDVEGGILDCKKAIEEFDNAILDLHWEVFQRIQDTFSNLKSEMQNIIGVIDDMDVADEKGNWTKEGLTQLGLYAQQMELARYQVEQYNREINQLNADYLAGRYSVTEYTDKLAELSSAQWDAVNSVESAKDAIKDLNEARIEIAIDGINKEIDAYEKLIKARIDALIAAKNLHDYEQLIAEKTANITKLEKQIAAMQNDNTAATVAKRKLLEEQLAQARKELEDAEYEHSMQAQEDALNKELEDYRAAREAEIEALRASLEEKEILIAQSLETVKANTSVIAQEITMIAQMHGIQVSEAIINPWYSGQNAIASYGETLSAGTSAFIGQIIGVENQVYQLQADANNTANSLAYMFATRADNLVDQLTSSYMSEANLNAMTQALRDSLIQTLEGGYNIGNITSALDSIADAANGVASAANNAAQALANMGAAQADMNSKTLYRIEGVAGGTITSHDKASLEKLVKQYGHGTVAPVKYAKGTRNSKGGISVTDEEGYELKLDNLGAGKYTIMNEGSQVLTKPETDNIFGWAKLDPDMFNLQMPLVDMPKYTPEMVRTNNQNVNLNYGSLITVNGDVNDTKHFLGQMETVAEKAITKTFRDFTHTLKYRG